MTDALAQSRERGDRDRDRGDRREQPRGYPSGRDRGDDRGGYERGERRGPSVNPGDVARRVQQGRPGRMLGVRESGGDYVVRWEYPGGRVSDIPVDGQSGRVRGD